MRKHDPWYKVLEGLWPIIIGAIAAIFWIINQTVSYRQQTTLIAHQEQRLDEDEKFNDQKHKEQDRNYMEQTVQNQNIQQQLGSIQQSVKGKR